MLKQLSTSSSCGEITNLMWVQHMGMDRRQLVYVWPNIFDIFQKGFLDWFQNIDPLDA